MADNTKKVEDTNPELEEGEIAEDELDTLDDCSQESQETKETSLTGSLSGSKRHLRHVRLGKYYSKNSGFPKTREREPRTSRRNGRNTGQVLDCETGINRKANSGSRKGGYSERSLSPQASASANANDDAFQEMIIEQFNRNAHQRNEEFLPVRSHTEPEESIPEAIKFMPASSQKVYRLLKNQERCREHNKQLKIKIKRYEVEKDEAQRKLEISEKEIFRITSHVINSPDIPRVGDLQTQLLSLLRHRKRNLEIVELYGKNLEICQRGIKVTLPIDVVLDAPGLPERTST